MFDRRLLQHFDWVLLLLLVVIGMASVLNLYSATYPIKGSGGSQIFMKQAYWFLLGIGVMLLNVVLVVVSATTTHDSAPSRRSPSSRSNATGARRCAVTRRGAT